MLGIDQSKVSRITRGQFRGISEAKLLELVTKLGRDVKIVVGPVRLPDSLVQERAIAEGDEIKLVPLGEKGEAPMTFAVKLAPSKLERLQAMRRYRAPFPPGFGFDRDEANAG